MALAYQDNEPADLALWLDPERPCIDAARAGDRDAFDALYRRYERTIYAFVYRTMGDADDAYDMTQETFTKAYNAMRATTDDLNFSAWLHRIAMNNCMDALRRRQRIHWQAWQNEKHDHLLMANPTEQPERVMLRAEERRTVQDTLNAMSRRHRTALILREFEGLSCEEIGVRIGLSRSAVKSMLFRARDEFRRVWERGGQPIPPKPKRLPRRRLRPAQRPWSTEDWALLRSLVEAGASYEVMSARLNRTVAAAKHKALKLQAQRKAVAS